MRLRKLLVTVVCCGLPCGPLTAQPPAQPPDEAAETLIEVQVQTMTLEEARRLLEQAEAVFYSRNQPEAIPQLSYLIDTLSGLSPTTEEAATGRELLTRALALRAEAQFNLGESAAAEHDLWLLLVQDPAYRLDPQQVSPKFSALLEELRARTVGQVELRVLPLDATVSLNGRVLPAGTGTVSLIAGSYRALVERPGYEAYAAELTVEPAGLTTLVTTLLRSSAVVTLATRPAGVEVVVDAELRGVTMPPDEAIAAGEEPAAGELVVDGLLAGAHDIELRKEGYRPKSLRANVDFLGDFSLEPIELEPTRGALRLSGLAEGTLLLVDGGVASPDDEGRIVLPPGEHSVEVTLGTLGRFLERLTVVDQAEHEVDVELRPTIALVGAAAPDPALADQLAATVARRLGEAGSWLFLDRTTPGRQVLERFGLGPGSMADAVAGRIKVDWWRLQALLDREITASLYLVVDQSAAASGGDPELWLWAAAPGAPDPGRWAPGEGDLLGRLAAALDRPIEPQRPWLGARLIDAPVAGGIMVSEVTPEGPAAAAGLAVGDLVTGISGQEVSARHELLERLAAGPQELAVRRAGALRRLAVTVGSAPFMPWPNRSIHEAPIRGAVLRLEVATAGGGMAPWLAQLQLAGVLLGERRWLGAAQLLRTIDAPEGAGVSRATVDYWLGVALAAAEPGSAEARRAFERAAAAPGATLEGPDGPLVAPRARLRLSLQGD